MQPSTTCHADHFWPKCLQQEQRPSPGAWQSVLSSTHLSRFLLREKISFPAALPPDQDLTQRKQRTAGWWVEGEPQHLLGNHQASVVHPGPRAAANGKSHYGHPDGLAMKRHSKKKIFKKQLCSGISYARLNSIMAFRVNPWRETHLGWAVPQKEINDLTGEH